MVGPVFVDKIDDCRQRGGLAAACRTGHQDEALLEEAEFLQRVRQTEFFETHDLGRNEAEYRADAVTIGENIAAETGRALEIVSEVSIVTLLPFQTVSLRGDLVNERFDRFRCENLLPNCDH